MKIFNKSTKKFTQEIGNFYKDIYPFIKVKKGNNMSLLGNMFGGKDKPKEVVVKKHKKASKRKKKKVDVKKIEEKVQKQVFNSDREVENYYRQERQRAKDLLNKLEKEKATSLIEIAKKQYNQIKNEKENIALLIRDLVSHTKDIAKKTSELNRDKKNNYKNIDFVKSLKNSFLKLEKETSNMVSVRRELANKEKILVDRMNKLAVESVDRLRLSDNENAEKLLEIEKSKRRLIDEAKVLLSQENHEILLNDRVLDNLSKIARDKVKALNKKLKDIRKERTDLLKKKQLLLISEEKAKEKLIHAEKRIEDLKSKYKKILSFR